MLALFLLTALLFGSWVLYRTKSKKTDTSKHVLFVTAHPDDELMFFGPTLFEEIRARAQRNDKSPQTKVHLLCLCNGNFYGDGNKREQELKSACNFLLNCTRYGSLTSDNSDIFALKIVDDAQLPDSPSIDWCPDLIKKYVVDYINRNKISKVITFDDYGISGHSNHIAIYRALSGKLDDCSVELWYLQSVSIFRKYLSVFDLIPTCIWSLLHNQWNIHAVSLVNYLFLVQSLRKHHSQMLWFRYLYSSTSRYMFINCLRQHSSNNKIH